MNRYLEGMEVLAAVAESNSLREAGQRLGVSGSAVSQSLRQLEDRLGVILVQRTTRSLRLTEPGERLYAAVRTGLSGIREAIAAVAELRAQPRGVLRLHVTPAAEQFLTGSLLGTFLAAEAQISLDLILSYEEVDIVARGYDAGIRLGEVIDRDMIAVPVSGDLRLFVVGAPSYFARHAEPKHPRDLVEHECVNWRPTADAPPYRWEFTEKGRDFAVEVPARVLSNDPQLNLRLARAGVGLALARDEYVRDDLARGDLVRVLDEFSTPFPGFFLYYPQRRQASPVLRAFLDHLRAHPVSGRASRVAPGGNARKKRKH
jgi:DNA-binding transcriptional LysR family regulator